MGATSKHVLLLLLLTICSLPRLAFPAPVALAAMKGGTNGNLYVPSPAYEPNVTALKVEEWCDMGPTDCQTNAAGTTLCGCDRVQCDQAGGVNPYYSTGPLFWGLAQWPNGKMDMIDFQYMNSVGTPEGTNIFPANPFEYLADCVPDRAIGMADLIPALTHQNMTGIYSADISTIYVVFNTGQNVPVNPLGYVDIPAGATSFTVYNSTGPVMALVTFWNSSVQTSVMTQSANPLGSQLVGYPVTFTCNYKSPLTSKIPGANVNVYINGVANQANETATGYEFNYTFTATGTYSWYCSGTDPTGLNLPASAPPESYVIKISYCNISWAAAPSAPNDFKTNPDIHFAHSVNQQVTVAVNLTDKDGAPVPNIIANITPPAGIDGGVMKQTTPSDPNGIAWVTFTEPATIGKYSTLSAIAPICPNGLNSQVTVASYINAYHDAASRINVTDPSSKKITLNPGDLYNITIQILDQYGNVCNSSFDGTAYNYTTNPYEFNSTVGINQTYKNSTNTWYYSIPNCSIRSPIECYTIFNTSSNTGGIPVGLEGIYTFQMYAYIPDLSTVVNNVTDDIQQFDLTYDVSQALDKSNFNAAISPRLTGDSVLVIYNQPLPPPDRLRVIAIPHQIKVNDSFNITIQAILPNDSINTTNNAIVEVRRLARLDAPSITNVLINGSCQLVNGVGSFLVTNAVSLQYFNVTGVYDIYAFQRANPANIKVNGTGTLVVANGQINHLDVIVDHNGVFRTLPFYATVSVRDAGDNIVTNFSGDVNVSCDPFTTDPQLQNATLTPADQGQTTFTFITNQSGTINCTAHAFDSVHNILINGTFSVLVVEPDMCTYYAIPPVVPSTPPLDAKIAENITPQIHDVMQQNSIVGPRLIGWDGTRMNGNYSVCLESYHSGRICVKWATSEVQYDKAPVSVCVKEFVYNPETDAHISDHINYNGTGDLLNTFKHPEIVWGWGYSGSTETYTNCSMDGNDKYSIRLIPPTPGNVHTDFFNVTVTLPLGALEAYNITNDTPLNPQELQAPAALLVLDQKVPVGGSDSGRIAKFDLPVPPSEAPLLEEYNYSLAGANAQALAYDNRGNIYVALTHSQKIMAMKLVKSYAPSLHFVKMVDVITLDGTPFFPYGMDTDSWGNLYIVGNTNPDQPDNKMCINVYNKTLDLIQSNNCCGALDSDGNCTETYEGTVPSITVNEAGSEVYIVKDKKRTCGWSASIWSCWWTGNPLYYEYNASNVSQSVANVSIFGDGGTGMTLFGSNPGENITDGACYSDTGGQVVEPGVDNTDGGAHYLRGIKIRKGVIFILDYMSISSNKDWTLCYPGYLLPGCFGCFVPGSWVYPGQCNHCANSILYENQMTRLLAFDTTNPGGPYKARITVQPNMTVMPLCVVQRTLIGPITICDLGCGYGLCTNSKTYLTHGMDVDEDFDVHVALSGPTNGIAEYRLNELSADPTLPGGGWSFDVIYGWIPDTSSIYSSRNLPGFGWTTPAFVTSNVTKPDAVIAYPDLIKMAMMSGVSCEGCSLEGAVQPSVCQKEIGATNQSEYKNINASLAGSNIVPGTPLIRINSTNPPVYRRNSISTNITAFIRFDAFEFEITRTPGGCSTPPGGASSTIIILKDLNVTSYSNNLERLVEGGGTYFALTRPSYPERPSRTPDTLPYLAYDYYSNRFFYKHFIMMDRMTNATGNINVMGPPPNQFWQGGEAGPNLPLNLAAWCGMFPDACSNPDAKEWILNASYRKSFQTIQNRYYGYEYLATVSTVNRFNEQVPVYGVNGYWNSTHQWDPHSDPDAKGSVNPDIIAAYAPGMIPLNNSVEWSYPFYYNFTPATVMRNPLPFIPDPLAVPPLGDHVWIAHTNVSSLLLSLDCVDMAGNPYVLSATLNNLGDIDLAGGKCHEIDGIAITGASGVASVFIQPKDMSSGDGICFERPGGSIAAQCSGTNAWFRQAIQPNTLVTYTVYPPEIPMETCYPLVGEPYGPPPSSLKILPVNISGPTILTIHGHNSTFNETGNNEFGSVSATANMAGNQFPNPLPINLSNRSLYFRSSSNVQFVMAGITAATPAVPWTKSINYIIGGWSLIASLGDGVLENITNVQCTDPFGCLFEFSNDSAGAHILGRAYLGQHLGFITSDVMTGAVAPDYTYQPARGEVQFVPDDPNVREFMNVSFINGKGYIGDKFNVYTDPNVIINIDNLTASNCSPCTTDADCPGGACDTVNNVCMNGDDCGVARHSSGIPCFPSYVCPRIDLTSINDTLSVSSDHVHNATQPTTVNIVGTDTTPQHDLIKGTAILSGAAYTPVPITGGQYSTVYLIEVINAAKGETLTFSTPLIPDVAGLYVPKANYTTKSSIGSIYPQPRTLRIMSDNPAGETLSYKIVGIKNNDELITETGVKGTSVECSLTGPTSVNKDILLDGLCAFKIDNIPTQTVGVEFPIRVTAVPTAAVVPPPAPVERLEYPAFSDAEDISLCGGSAWDLATKNGAAACFTTQPIPPVIPGHWDSVLDYPSFSSEGQNVDGFVWWTEQFPDDMGAGIKTWWSCLQSAGVIMYKSATPMNISDILLRVKTSGEGQYIRVRISNDSSCMAGVNAETDFLAADMLNTPAPEYRITPQGNVGYHDNNLNYSSPAVSGQKWDNIYCIGLYAAHECVGFGCPLSCGQQEFFIDTVGVYKDVYTPPIVPPPPPPDSFAVVKFVNPTDIDGFTVTAKSLTPTTAKKLTIMASSNPGCLSHNPVADSNPLNWGMTHDVTLIADGTWHDNVDPEPGIFKGALCLAYEQVSDPNAKWLIDSVGIDVPQPQAVFPLITASSVGPACAGSNLMLGPPDGQEACSPQKLYGKFDKSYSLSGFLIYARTNPVTSPTIDFRISNEPNCWTQANAGDFSSFNSYATFHATSPGIDSYVLENGIVNVRCVEAVLSGGSKLYIDAVGIMKEAGQADCSLFSGNANLGGAGCPSTIGPFSHGVWTGMVMETSPGNAQLTATDFAITGTSNLFPVNIVPGAASASFLTTNQFTHVLAVEIHGTAGENYRVTTAPMFVDYPNDQVPEQIGVIDVIPNDFAIGFHQNTTGTYIYSQQDLVQVNIPDNNSLGLHNFQFSYYDRFNNTFIVPYTIWLRQPTAIVLNIITNRDPASLYKTNVNITAQLLYQRFDDPDGKPSIPISAGYEIKLYVQNSSESPFYGDIPVETHPAAAPLNCDPTVAGVCPNPAIPGLSIEDSNCSCPDWWDDPANPGECIPNPNCHQYGVLANEDGSEIFLTNDSGWVNATFSIFGFGRRLMFAVFNGTRDYAPSIQIQPFYAGGLSVAMGQFPILEPVLLMSAALGLMTIKRKFNKQKSG